MAELQETVTHEVGIFTRVAQQIGGSFGAAVLAVILDAGLRNLAAHPRTALAQATVFDQAFWWAGGVTGAAMVLSLTLPARTGGDLPVDLMVKSTIPLTSR